MWAANMGATAATTAAAKATEVTKTAATKATRATGVTVPAPRKRASGGNGETGTAQKRTPAVAKRTPAKRSTPRPRVATDAATLPASLARTAGSGE
jgi:hypothetical protein